MRIGLVGWACRTGIGHINRDLWETGIVDTWLVPRHPVLGYDEQLCPPEAVRCQVKGQPSEYHRWLDGVDAVLLIECPFLQDFDLIGEAHRRGAIVCLVPMLEWLPSPERVQWVREVDMQWAPTEWTGAELTADAARTPCRWQSSIYGGRWGINVEQFAFRQRKVCERILFVNGHGGAAGRKGAACVAKAAALLPMIEFLVRSQQPLADMPKMPSNCRIISGELLDRWSLYDEGDVLLAPSKWEGLGLQLYEAQACGLGVVTTDGDPMREAGPVRKVRVSSSGSVSLCAGRKLPSYDADPAHLAAHVRDLYGRDISGGSLAARQYIERHHDIRNVAAELRAAIIEQHAETHRLAA